MTNTELAYEWGLKWSLQYEALTQTEEERYLTVEQVMRDWDMHNPDTLTDEQWDDVCYCIRDELTERVEGDN